jgi:hypothetical protein
MAAERAMSEPDPFDADEHGSLGNPCFPKALN